MFNVTPLQRRSDDVVVTLCVYWEEVMFNVTALQRRCCDVVCLLGRGHVQILNRTSMVRIKVSGYFRKYNMFSRTSMARTSLGPWKFVLDMGSPSH